MVPRHCAPERKRSNKKLWKKEDKIWKLDELKIIWREKRESSSHIRDLRNIWPRKSAHLAGWIFSYQGICYHCMNGQKNSTNRSYSFSGVSHLCRLFYPQQELTVSISFYWLSLIIVILLMINRSLLISCQKNIYLFLKEAMQHWPIDSSFRLVEETWLSYIQPWRYTSNRWR